MALHGRHGSSDYERNTAHLHPNERQLYMPPRRSPLKTVLVGLVCVLCALFVGVGVASAAYYFHVSDLLNNGQKSQEELDQLDEVLETTGFDDPFYLILIGSDARADDPSMGARSDTNIVVRVDAPRGQLTLVSIPRDTRIEIPGHGVNKFNAAYAFGKAPGVIDAAEELLDIDIAHYAEVNFEELVDLVDAVGGVDVDVDVRIDDPKADLDYETRHIVLEPGLQRLDGQEALAFSRSRAFASGDFARAAHQRQLIEALIDEVLALPLTKMPTVIEKAAACVTTDLKITEILTLANMFRDAETITMYSAMVPSVPAMIGGVSYVLTNEEATAAMMKLVEAGDDPNSLDLDEYPMPVYVDTEGTEEDEGTALDPSESSTFNGGYYSYDDESFWSATDGNEIYVTPDEEAASPPEVIVYPEEPDPGTSTDLEDAWSHRLQ